MALVGVLGYLPGVSAAQAVQLTLAWDPSTSPSVGGYVLYYGHASRNYTDSIDVGDRIQYTLTDLEAGTAYYFAIAAYDTTRTIRSDFSNEVHYPALATSPNVSLESPTQGSFESGIGLIRGWVCQANTVEVRIDNGARWEVGYGTARDDTVEACGDSDNGFGYTINWNRLGDGPHTLRAFADGVEFANVDFTVTTLGVEYLQGASAEFVLPNFPSAGNDVAVRWSEPHQNFMIVDANRNSTDPRSIRTVSLAQFPAYLESPQQGSFESGIGLIRGWVCQASTVEIQIDGGARRRVAYGTTRPDTVGVCGDADNGFGYTFNWNRLGNGSHNVRVSADGVEFANVDFTVTSLGVEYLQGASGEFVLSNFPSTGNDIAVRWSEPYQNFAIVNGQASAR
ncbi:MAG: fibronectin type III domain-containing protein [Candidatus Competibacter sp.]|nr:fibronectin type III domain-containing protein [Candidatus Competibacter sp.]MDG4583516.1 fibronectin type III domain-containing protein [Candidatus Competibacter sp.]